MTRVILYTGKGGVGKTSLAAATALASARRGTRTLVLSTDAAHSLGDCFDVELSPEPVQIAANLWGQETDVSYNIKKYWGTLQQWLQSVLAWEGIDAVLAEEIAILPGMDELAGLLWLLEHHRSGTFDTIIVDCAPTAETFRLLSFPESGSWWLDKFFPLSRRLSSVASPLLQRLTDLPMPGDDVFREIEQLMVQIRQVQAILNDPGVTSVRLVVNPENMVIKEARRAFTWLSLYGYLIDLVICNRVLPTDTKDGYFRAAWEQQQRYLTTIDETFAPVPVRRVPFLPNEVTGFTVLEVLAQSLFGDDDPSAFYWRGAPFKVERLEPRSSEAAPEAEYLLTLNVPLAHRDEMSLIQTPDELVISVGQYRRNLLLPRALQGRQVRQARLSDGTLRVWFGGENGFRPGTRSESRRTTRQG